MTAIVDYSGEWLNTSQEEMDALLKSVGVGWAQRKMASAMNFEVGKAKMIIQQDGDVVSIENIAFNNTKNRLCVGSGEQDLQGESGLTPGRAEWGENGELVLYTLMRGKNVIITRRLIDANTLEMTIVHGSVTAKRIYTLQ